MSTHKVFLRNPDVILRDEDEDGGLLFNPDTNQILVLNPTATCIWKACESSCNLASIMQAVLDEFDEVPEETAVPDINKFIDSMIKGGFICLTAK